VKKLSEEKINKLPQAKLSPLAENDLRETWLYISENSKEFADKTIDSILQKCELIALNPQMGKLKHDLIVDLRSFPYKHFNIYYFQTEFSVEIYRVLHSSRDNIQVFDEVIDEAE
jgi:toxin ParE1/3/4